MNNLALLMDATGAHEESRPLHEEALSIRINAFGEVDASVAETLLNLGTRASLLDPSRAPLPIPDMDFYLVRVHFYAIVVLCP